MSTTYAQPEWDDRATALLRERLQEVHSDERYRRRIAHQRSLGLAYVGTQLDQMCRDLGLDPVQVWRMPRYREERDRRDMAAYHLQQRAAIAVGSLKRAIGGDVA